MERLEDNNFTISKTIKRIPPIEGCVFGDIKDEVVGTKYKLSLVFIGEKRSRALNRTYRGKNRPTDILSFPLSENEGEIFINPYRSQIESRKFGRKLPNFLQFLFIHGLCHLKGMTHGSRMEYIERKYRKIFNV